jgi:hypothetical protein
MPKFATFTPLELALRRAVHLLNSMDSFAGLGGAFLVPEAIVWAIEQLEPELIELLRDGNRLTVFKQYLLHYKSLRETAEEIRYEDDTQSAVPSGKDYGKSAY